MALEIVCADGKPIVLRAVNYVIACERSDPESWLLEHMVDERLRVVSEPERGVHHHRLAALAGRRPLLAGEEPPFLNRPYPLKEARFVNSGPPAFGTQPPMPCIPRKECGEAATLSVAIGRALVKAASRAIDGTWAALEWAERKSGCGAICVPLWVGEAAYAVLWIMLLATGWRWFLRAWM